MKLAKSLIIITALLALALPLHAGEPSADSPQSLYLQAGKEERSGSSVTARAIYESIIDRFPESEFAVKANDRLLALPTAKQKTETPPVPSPFTFFAPKPSKPLPEDLLLRRGVETARMKTKAEAIRRGEIERQRERYYLREGHRINRSVLAEKESQWQKAADQKIVAEFGMNLDEMGEKLQQLCSEAKVKGECSEEGFNLLATTP